MVVITFPTEDLHQRALGFLLKRFSGTALKSGEVIVPKAALAALAEENITFTVLGTASYEKQIAALRSLCAS